jgi:hypothetical protein
MSKYVGALTVVLFGGLLSLFPQSVRTLEYLPIEGQRLSLGMTREDVAARIAACCTYNNGFIVTKNGPPYHMLGAIVFRDNRVSYLRRDVAQYQEAETGEFALQLYRTISDIQKQGVVSLRVESSELSNGSSKDLVIGFSGGRTVKISVLIPDNTSTVRRAVELTEELRN